MKKCLLSLLIFISYSQFFLYSQTITSKSTGGLWDDVNTWIGGVVPGQNNDVVIDGTVSVNQTCNIRSLTINSGKIFQPYSYYGVYTVNLSGSLTNNGIIRLNPNGNIFDISVAGNVTNNGQWDSRNLAFGGTSTQYISQGQGKFFNTALRKRNWDNSTYSTNKVVATSNITLKGDFELNGFYNSSWQNGILDMSGYTLTLAGTARVLYGTVQNAAHLYLTESSRLESIEFTGNMTLHGTGFIFNSDVYFNDVVTIADTLQPWPYYSPRVNFKGSIINNGIIRSHKDGQFLDIVVWGNVNNNGTWQTRNALFPAKYNQVISQTSGKSFETDIYKRDIDNIGYSTGKLTAGSDLIFKGTFYLNSIISSSWVWSEFDMAGYSLYMMGSANIVYGTVKNATHLYMSENSRLESINFDGTMTLHNAIRIFNSECGL